MARITVWVQHFKDRPNLVLQWHDQAGKRRSRSTGTADPAEAERQRADLEYELNHGLHQEPSALSWEAFRRLFFAEHVAGCRPSTRHNFAEAFDAMERVCHPARLAAVNERVLSAFVAAYRQRTTARGPIKASTIDTYLRALRTALRWAVRQKLLPAVPAFPAVKVPRKRPRPVPEADFAALLARAPDAAWRAFLLCGWLAGLRLAEALALERRETVEGPWVDWTAGRIVFPAEFVKGVEDQWIPLDAELRAAMEALPDTGPRFFGFTDAHGRRLANGSVGGRVRKLAQAAGLRMNYRSLRRGFGCYYAARVPAQVLQKLMRHADIRTTLQFYVSIDAAAEEAVRQRSRSATPEPPEKP